MRKDIRSSDWLSLALHRHNIFSTSYCFATYVFLLPTDFYITYVVRYITVSLEKLFLLTVHTIKIILTTGIRTRRNRYWRLGTLHVHFYVPHFKLLKITISSNFHSRFNSSYNERVGALCQADGRNTKLDTIEGCEERHPHNGSRICHRHRHILGTGFCMVGALYHTGKSTNNLTS